MFKLRNIIAVLGVVLSLQSGFAQAEAPLKSALKSDIEVVLQQHKVSKHGNEEKLEAVERINPGEMVEYQAVYRNVSTHEVKQLQATLPIPAETEYVPNSARPQNVMASTDGVSYAAVPLRKKVKLNNGKIEERDVPVTEYRSLRWAVGDLAAGQKATVFARIRLAPVGQALAEVAKK